MTLISSTSQPISSPTGHATRDYATLRDWLPITRRACPLPAGASVNRPLPDAAYVRPLADRHGTFVLFEQAITGQTAQRILFFQGSSSTGEVRSCSTRC